MAQNGLKDKANLLKLSLEGNFIGGVGLIAVAEALTPNAELQELYLYNNHLDDSGME